MMQEQVDTPTAILASAAAMLRECAFDDITYRALGGHVGVSERTVYRQFPTRSHLLTALARHLESTTFAMHAFDDLAAFRKVARARFRDFDLAPAYAFVLARAAMISPVHPAEPTLLTQRITAMVHREASGLSARDAGRVATSLRYFSSAVMWSRLRTGFDMDATEISDSFDETVSRLVQRLPSAAWSSP